MSITDELRDYATTRISPNKGMLEAIADRIDAEHQKALTQERNKGFTDGYDMGFASADDWLAQHEDAMAEHGWVRLPVDGEAPCKQLGEWIEKRGLITGPLDHDGELWHKGDMSASPWGVIEGIVFENGKWFIRGHDTSAPWVPADSISRYHEPTVEDVLREFADEVYADADNEIRDRDFLCAKYAKRLTLAETEDA